jgi:putative membrane protein
VTGALLAAFYGWRYLEAPAEKVRPWGWSFLAVGLVLALPALHLTLTWPLPGGNNIIMGEPAFYFGVLLAVAGLVILRGHDLRPLAWLSLPGGVALVTIAVAILQHNLTRSPVMWAIAYAAIGIAAILVPFAYRVPVLRPIAGILLVVGAAIFPFGAIGAYIEHPGPDNFGKWQPLPMRS